MAKGTKVVGSGFVLRLFVLLSFSTHECCFVSMVTVDSHHTLPTSALQSAKETTRFSDSCWSSCLRKARGRDDRPSSDQTLHYTTLHCTALHYTTLPYTPLRCTTLNYTTLLCTALHYTTLRYTTLHYTTLHYTTQHCTTLHYTTLHYATLHYTTVSLMGLKGASHL